MAQHKKAPLKPESCDYFRSILTLDVLTELFNNLEKDDDIGYSEEYKRILTRKYEHGYNVPVSG